MSNSLPNTSIPFSIWVLIQCFRPGQLVVYHNLPKVLINIQNEDAKCFKHCQESCHLNLQGEGLIHIHIIMCIYIYTYIIYIYIHKYIQTCIYIYVANQTWKTRTSLLLGRYECRWPPSWLRSSEKVSESVVQHTVRCGSLRHKSLSPNGKRKSILSEPIQRTKHEAP